MAVELNPWAEAFCPKNGKPTDKAHSNIPRIPEEDPDIPQEEPGTSKPGRKHTRGKRGGNKKPSRKQKERKAKIASQKRAEKRIAQHKKDAAQAFLNAAYTQACQRRPQWEEVQQTILRIGSRSSNVEFLQYVNQWLDMHIEEILQ